MFIQLKLTPLTDDIEQVLQDEFERSLGYKSSFVLIMFDIDIFKKINDQYGHPCEDKVIE